MSDECRFDNRPMRWCLTHNHQPALCTHAAAALRAERDLAIAHDHQPYPTADAYEKVCAALEASKARVWELEAALYAIAKSITDRSGYLEPGKHRE